MEMKKNQCNEVDVMDFSKQFVECSSVREMQRRLAEVAGETVPHYLVANGELMQVWLEKDINIELMAENIDQLHRINWGRKWCQINILTERQVKMLTMYGVGVVQESGTRKSGIKIYYRGRKKGLFGKNKKKELLCSIAADYERGNKSAETAE